MDTSYEYKEETQKFLNSFISVKAKAVIETPLLNI